MGGGEILDQRVRRPSEPDRELLAGIEHVREQVRPPLHFLLLFIELDLIAELLLEVRVLMASFVERHALGEVAAVKRSQNRPYDSEIRIRLETEKGAKV